MKLSHVTGPCHMVAAMAAPLKAPAACRDSFAENCTGDFNARRHERFRPTMFPGQFPATLPVPAICRSAAFWSAYHLTRHSRSRHVCSR
jgi:hypothetical protein